MSDTHSSELEQILEQTGVAYCIAHASVDGSELTKAIAAIEKLMVRERIDELRNYPVKQSALGYGGNTPYMTKRMIDDRIAELQKQLEPQHIHRFGNIILTSNPPQKRCLDCGEYVYV